MFVLFSNSLPHQQTQSPNENSRLGTGTVNGPGTTIFAEGDGGQHEHHNKLNNDKEENKGWFAILHLHLLPFAANCGLVSFNEVTTIFPTRQFNYSTVSTK